LLKVASQLVAGGQLKLDLRDRVGAADAPNPEVSSSIQGDFGGKVPPLA
jgi:hypothetical protein